MLTEAGLSPSGLAETLLPGVKRLRFVKLSDKVDAELLEKILIARHEDQTGAMPPVNSIRA
jgi:hypothetical protein